MTNMMILYGSCLRETAKQRTFDERFQLQFETDSKKEI